jgi:hypothetical protein
LRKDFPLIGYVEIYYSLASKSMEYRKVYMKQDFRLMNNYINPWKLAYNIIEENDVEIEEMEE